MSGGGVLDMHCHVLGITELKSKHGQGGQFVWLLPSVMARIVASIANASWLPLAPQPDKPEGGAHP